MYSLDARSSLPPPMPVCKPPHHDLRVLGDVLEVVGHVLVSVAHGRLAKLLLLRPRRPLRARGEAGGAGGGAGKGRIEHCFRGCAVPTKAEGGARTPCMRRRREARQSAPLGSTQHGRPGKAPGSGRRPTRSRCARPAPRCAWTGEGAGDVARHVWALVAVQVRRRWGGGEGLSAGCCACANRLGRVARAINPAAVPLGACRLLTAGTCTPLDPLHSATPPLRCAELSRLPACRPLCAPTLPRATYRLSCPRRRLPVHLFGLPQHLAPARRRRADPARRLARCP